MKPPSADLIELIRSLTQAEKRYCRIALQNRNLKHKQIKLDLFDAIYDKVIFNEDTLQEWSHGAQFNGNLTSLKHQLQEQILTALHHYYENQDERARLYKEYHSALILYRKGLQNAFQSRLKKLKKEADRHELHDLKLAVHDLEQQLNQPYSKFTKRLDHIQGLFNQKASALAKLANENHFWVIFNRLYQYQIRQTQTPYEEEYPEVKALLAGEKPHFKQKPQTFKARLDYYQALALSAFMNGQTRQAFRFNRAFLRFFEANPNHGKRFPKRYLTIYNNYLIDGFTLGYYDTVEAGIRHLRNLRNLPFHSATPTLQLEIFRLTGLLELNLCLARQDFQKGLDFSDEIQEELEAYGPDLPPESFISIHYLCAYFNFILGELEKALAWINPVFKAYKKQDIPVIEIYRHAQILHLIIHYELGNSDYLAYALVNTQKQLKREQHQRPVFDLTIQHLKQLIDLPVNEDASQFWQEYRQALSNKQETQTLFDFLHWAEAHSKEISMALAMEGS